LLFSAAANPQFHSLALPDALPISVPAVVKALTDAARRDPDRFGSLELVVTGGANLPASIRDGLAEILPTVRLISYYGAAEIGFIDRKSTRLNSSHVSISYAVFCLK